MIPLTILGVIALTVIIINKYHNVQGNPSVKEEIEKPDPLRHYQPPSNKARPGQEFCPERGYYRSKPQYVVEEERAKLETQNQPEAAEPPQEQEPPRIRGPRRESIFTSHTAVTPEPVLPPEPTPTSSPLPTLDEKPAPKKSAFAPTKEEMERSLKIVRFQLSELEGDSLDEFIEKMEGVLREGRTSKTKDTRPQPKPVQPRPEATKPAPVKPVEPVNPVEEYRKPYFIPQGGPTTY